VTLSGCHRCSTDRFLLSGAVVSKRLKHDFSLTEEFYGCWGMAEVHFLFCSFGLADGPPAYSRWSDACQAIKTRHGKTGLTIWNLNVDPTPNGYVGLRVRKHLESSWLSIKMLRLHIGNSNVKYKRSYFILFVHLALLIMSFIYLF